MAKKQDYATPNKLALLLNEALRILFGGIYFWLIYYVAFNFYDAKTDLFSRIGIVILCSSIASLMAVESAYLFWLLLQNYYQWKHFLFKELNRGVALYITMIGIIITAGFTALGISGYLWGLAGGDWWRFFGWYIFYKFCAWLLAYLLGWPLNRVNKSKRFIYYCVIGLIFMGLVLLGIVALLNYELLQ
jgi:hypothetical protein